MVCPKADIDCIVDQPLAAHKHHAYAKHIFKYGKAIEKFPIIYLYMQVVLLFQNAAFELSYGIDSNAERDFDYPF